MPKAKGSTNGRRAAKSGAREKRYTYVTQAQWAYMRAVAEGRMKGQPIWSLQMVTLRSLIDPVMRGWLSVDPEGNLAFTADGYDAYQQYTARSFPKRNPDGEAYKSGILSPTVGTLLSQRAARAVERAVRPSETEVKK